MPLFPEHSTQPPVARDGVYRAGVPAVALLQLRLGVADVPTQAADFCSNTWYSTNVDGMNASNAAKEKKYDTILEAKIEVTSAARTRGSRRCARWSALRQPL